MLDTTHALIQDFLQQKTIAAMPGAREAAPGKRYNKAGLLPFMRDEALAFYLMKPRSSSPELGAPPFQICKGTRMYYTQALGWRDMREEVAVVEKLETLIQTALREGMEELGLLLDNIETLYDLGPYDFTSVTTGKGKSMWLFAAEVKDAEHFQRDSEVAFSTESRAWLTPAEFSVGGRKDHRYIVEDVAKKIAGLADAAH